MMRMLRADALRWSLGDPEQPAACRVAEDVGPPSGLTASRADLAIWWHWRYAALEAENARLAGLLVQALGESQAYRAVLQAALDVLRQQARRHDRLSEQLGRLRDKYRSRRDRVRPTEQRAGRGTAA